MSGKLIVMCGIDGSGKTSQAHSLKEMLINKGFKAKVIQLLSRKSNMFRDLESLIPRISKQTYCELVAFERYRRIKIMIPRGLKRYDYIICDRYFFTDLAYSYAYQCDMNFFQQLVSDIPTPDLVFLFDVSAQTALERIEKRGDLWSTQENPHVLCRAREAYLKIACQYNMILVNSEESNNNISNFILEKVKFNLSE